MGSHDDDPLLDTEIIPKHGPPPIARMFEKMILFALNYIVSFTKLDPEAEDETPDNEGTPNTAEAHPGVDDGFFSDHPLKPAIVPRVGHDDGHGETGHSGNGHGPSNGHIPRRRPSFPYAPGYEPDVVSMRIRLVTVIGSHFLIVSTQ